MKKFILLLAILLLLNSSFAGKISITTKSSKTTFKDGVGNVSFRILNSGDEPAHRMVVSIISDAFDIDDINVGTLDPNSTFRTSFDVNVDQNLLPGTYSNIIIKEYQDANGYQFSAVSPLSVNIEAASDFKVDGKLSRVTLKDKGPQKIVLKLENKDTIDHEITVRMFSSTNLEVDGDEKTVNVEAGGTKNVDFDISNLSGLDGSRYVVLALMNYSDSEYHSKITNGIVEIHSSTTVPFRDEKSASKVVFVIILAVIIASIILVISYFFGKNIRVEIKRVVNT